MGKVTPVSDDELRAKAAEYDVLSEFRKKEESAYVLIHRRGLLKELCGHMKRGLRSFPNDKLAEIALGYNNRLEFRTKNRPAYFAAIRHGILDDICKHMDQSRVVNGYWTKEHCREEALKFKTRSEFHNHSYAYQIAEKNGWLDEICSLMVTRGNWQKRKIYVFTFSDGYAYVGLAQDPDERRRKHLSGKDSHSPILPHIKETGATCEFSVLTDWLDKDAAGKAEDRYIKQYAADGWKMLNRRKGGALGSPKFWRYTEEKIREEVYKYEYVEDFRNGSRRLYNYILSNKLFDRYCSHLKRRKKPTETWTIEQAITVVHECSTKTGLLKKYRPAYKALKRAGLIEKFYPANAVPEKVWTLEKSLTVVPLCSSRSELMRKYSCAYETLRKAGALDDILPSKRSLPEDVHLSRISECGYRKELQRKYPGTYSWARTNGLLDKYFPK
jgi:predicted GIY-YIG superfamily endonuclease